MARKRVVLWFAWMTALLSAASCSTLTAYFGMSASVITTVSTAAPPTEQLPTEAALDAAAQGDAAAVEAAMQHYGELIKAMDAEGIAALYTPDGVMSDTRRSFQGPQAIHDYLASFNGQGIEVTDYSVTTHSLTLEGDTAVQEAVYDQTVRLATGRVVHARGRIHAEWVRQPDGEWLVRLLHTVP